MPERRSSKRRHLIYYPRILDRDTGELLGRVIDITSDGVMMLSDHPIQVGLRYHLRMEVLGDGNDNTSLAFDGISLWCKPDINPDYYDTGFQLNDVDAATLIRIEQMIAEHGFRD